MKYNILALIVTGICLLFLSGCSSPATTTDISGDLFFCKIASTDIQCQLNNGNVIKADMIKVMSIASWDESMWKENIAYCPKDYNSTDKSGCINETIKFCFKNNEWVEC